MSSEAEGEALPFEAEWRERWLGLREGDSEWEWEWECKELAAVSAAAAAMVATAEDAACDSGECERVWCTIESRMLVLSCKPNQTKPPTINQYVCKARAKRKAK